MQHFPSSLRAELRGLEIKDLAGFQDGPTKPSPPDARTTGQFKHFGLKPQSMQRNLGPHFSLLRVALRVDCFPQADI